MTFMRKFILKILMINKIYNKFNKIFFVNYKFNKNKQMSQYNKIIICLIKFYNDNMNQLCL